MSEEYVSDVILTELLSASRALPVSVAQVLVDAFLAEQVEAASDGGAFEPVLANGATQHAQSHVQHVQILLFTTTTTTTTATTTTAVAIIAIVSANIIAAAAFAILFIARLFGFDRF